MNKFIFPFVGFALIVGSLPALADIELRVDFDPSTPGIQSTIVVAPDGTVDVDIVMRLTDGTTVSAYQFSVVFDTTELAFISRTETFPSGFGFAETDSTNINDLQNGQLFRFGGDAGAGPSAASDPFVVASLKFWATMPSTSTGDLDVRPLILESQGDAFLRNVNFETIPITEQLLSGGSVSQWTTTQ